jgi:hypothetical protein
MHAEPSLILYDPEGEARHVPLDGSATLLVDASGPPPTLTRGRVLRPRARGPGRDRDDAERPWVTRPDHLRHRREAVRRANLSRPTLVDARVNPGTPPLARLRSDRSTTEARPSAMSPFGSERLVALLLALISPPRGDRALVRMGLTSVALLSVLSGSRRWPVSLDRPRRRKLPAT